MAKRLTTVTLRGVELLDAIDEVKAERKDETRSVTVRVLIREALQRRGRWPPQKKEEA